MYDINRVFLQGNVGQEPEVRALPNGDPVVSLRLATNRKWKHDGEQKTDTQWHTVVIFDPKLCEIAEQYIEKGTRVFISGELRTRTWEKDGVKRYSTEVVLARYRGELGLEGRPERTETASETKPAAADEPYDDDVPF